VVRRHSSTLYHVYMLGFLPGFAYMGAVDVSIAMPRRAAPRAVVPAGSVGIAGRQTGVYPSPSPGGWRLVGRTPWRMFDVGRASPALLAAGDTVRFVSVPVDDWSRLGEGPDSR
jgi:inhibitor of KinA